MAVSCNYTKFYSTDSTLQVGSKIYLNNSTPLNPAPEGYYCPNPGASPSRIYKVDSQGNIISILSSMDNECSNNVPVTSKFYLAEKYFCTSCINSIVTNSQGEVYVKCPTYTNLTIGKYYTVGNSILVSPDQENFVYRITGGPWENNTFIADATIDPDTGSNSCSSPCAGATQNPQA